MLQLALSLQLQLPGHIYSEFYDCDFNNFIYKIINNKSTLAHVTQLHRVDRTLLLSIF